MNLKEALKILKERGYNKVAPREDGHFDAHFQDGTFWKILSAREVISWARDYTSNSPSNTKIKSNVKHYGKRKNRAGERDAIQSKDFDKIPNVKGRLGRVKDDDLWNWD